MTCRVAIIGIGSARGNDRLGWDLIDRLQADDFESRFANGTVSLLTCRFPAQLVQLMEACEHALVIDAVRQPAGQLSEFTRQDLLLSGDICSTHGMGVGEALALADVLLPDPVPVRILGIGAGCRDEDAMPDVDALMPEVADWLSGAIESACKG